LGTVRPAELVAPAAAAPAFEVDGFTGEYSDSPSESAATL
jgi:hypothetical protein